MENLRDRSLSGERKKTTTEFKSEGNEEIGDFDSNTKEIINREMEQRRYVDQGILLKKL